MLQLAVAGRTMQNRCKTYVPSVSFRGLTYVYRENAFIEREKIINKHCKYRAILYATKIHF